MKLKLKQTGVWFCLLCTALSLSACAWSAKTNQMIAENYISSKHGPNFQITGYEPPVDSASGMRPARVHVEQNGFQYSLGIQDGKVIEDSYSENYAGKIVLDTIFDKLKQSNTCPDLAGRKIETGCIVLVTDPTLLEIPIDLSGAKDYNDILLSANQAGGMASAYITVRILDNADYRSEEWLYDLYLICQDELENYDLSVALADGGMNFVHWGNAGGAPGPKEATVSMEEFYAKFY